MKVSQVMQAILELLSDRARADTSAPGSSSWLSNMEFSSNSMTDNSFDKDNPLKQVLQLCSTLAGKGCDFSISVRIRDCFSFSLKSGKPQPQQAKKRSPSFYRRQERRRLLRKKNKDLSLEEPRETPQAKEKDTDSLDLNPHPDIDLFGLKENSEEESDSSDSGSETSRDASRGDQEAVSEDPDDMNKDGDWKVVTARGRRKSDRSLSPVPMIKHRFVVRHRNIEKEVFVNAPAHVAKADVAHAFQNSQRYNPELYNQSCYFRPELYDWERNIKYIPESQEYEFISNTKSFKH